MHGQGRSTARSIARECLLSGNGPVDRPSQRLKNRPLAVDQAVDRQQSELLSWLPTGRFLEPIKRGSLGLFYIRFQVGLWASFSYTSKCLSPLVLESKLPYQKESLSRVFSKEFFLSFLPQSFLVFSHILELSIAISYRRVIVRVILGDQSVVITNVLIFDLRRRTCGFAVFRVLVRAYCRGVVSTS